MNHSFAVRHSIFILVICISFLTGCTLHITKDISKRLDHDELNRSYNINPVDLSSLSKCEERPTVKIVNVEHRTEGFEVMDNGPFTGTVNPKEMMDEVAIYLKNGFIRSQINVDDQSTKVLEIKMIDLKSIVGVWSFGSHCKLELSIPETGFRKFYESRDNALSGYTAPAYAIHTVARQIIDDPFIQDYILCKDEGQKPKGNRDADSLSKKLQELQAALKDGLISHEEYQLKRKAILEKH